MGLSDCRGNVSVLVTGGTGFIGSCLTKRLLAVGCEVHAICRQGSLFCTPSQFPSFHLYQHDGSTKGIVDIMKRSSPDIVIHLASLFLGQHQPEDVGQLVASNILFGMQLLEAMSLNGTGLFLNTGTSWQNYQDLAYSPVNLYAATKQAFEDIVRYYAEALGLKAITLRLFDTYGPGDNRPKLMPLLKRAASSGELLELSPGAQLIDLVFIDDVIDCFMLAVRRLMEGRVSQPEVYAVSSGEPVTLKCLVETYGQVTGKELNVEWGARPYRLREVMLPWRNGQRLPGWVPKTSLAQGLKIFDSTDSL